MSLSYQQVVKDTSEIIREKSQNVPLPLSDEDKQLLMDMFHSVQNSQDEELAEKLDLRPAVGIAAIQLGVPKKMLAVVVPKDEEEDYEFALANAKIISESVQRAYLKAGEGCLSVDGDHPGYVPRAARIKVKAYDLLRDQEVVITASGYLAIVLQHEIDHFSGTLFYDRINKENPWQEIENAIIIE